MTSEEKTKLKDLDRTFVWHPFTQMQDYAQEEPVIISRANGVYLEDINGKRYLDGFSSMWCNIHGHRVPEINKAVKDQLDQVAHTTLLGLSNIPAIRLAEKLIQIVPLGLTHVFYSDSGATAVEIALKMAFQYWHQRSDPKPEKKTFLHLSESYHGDTLGAVSVGGIRSFHECYRPLLFNSITIPTPHPRYCTFCAPKAVCTHGCLQGLETILKRDGEHIAAFIIEPLIQCAGGMLVHPTGYLKGAKDLCRKYNILLIIDEVATGFGRTGTMFACEQEGISPDLLCIGKGLTGGYLPLAATLSTNEIYNAFLNNDCKEKTFYHGHTYTGNPLGCAAALANIEKFEKEHTLETLRPKIEHLQKGLARFKSFPHISEIRQCGFIAAIELTADKQTNHPFCKKDRISVNVCREARTRGLLIRPLGNTVVVIPPLSILKPELDQLLNIVYDSIRKVTKTGFRP